MYSRRGTAVAGLNGAYAPVSAAWQANTAYKAGELVTNGGSLYSANADFTSGVSFNAANWTAVGGGASSALVPVAKTTTYTAAANDLVLADASGGAFTVTVPVVGRTAVKKVDASTNAVTVSPASGTIDGAASLLIRSQYNSYELVGDGTNCWIV